MKNKTKAPTGAKCTSTASGGVLKCVLGGEHDVHSTRVPGRKGAQFSTWSLGEDGRIWVTSFATSGKQQGKWDEDPPAVAAESKLCPVCGGVQCLGTPSGECIYAMKPKSDVEAVFAPNKNPDRSLADACPKCGFELGQHTGKRCPKAVKSARQKHDNSAPAEVIAPAPIKFTDLCLKCGLAKHAGKCATARKSEAASQAVAPAKVTKIGDHEVHPAAALFPMIGDAEWSAFVADIKESGQRKKIVRIWDGNRWLILDGRNRLRACLELKVEPRFRVFGDETGDGVDPIAFVVSENVQRRHLNETQRAFVGAELVPMYEAQAQERQRASLKHGDQDPVAANVRRRDDGTFAQSLPLGGRSAELAARAVNVSARSVEHALRVNRDGAPEVIAAAKERGQIKVSTAAELTKLPQQKQREIVEKIGGGELRSGKVRSLVNQEKKRDVVRAINEQKVMPAPLGPFGVIVIDPPWPYENSDQHEGSRGHMDYPTMSIQQLCEMAPELDVRAKEDCILGLWVTNAFVHEIGRLLFSWGFDHRTVITWDKEIAGVGMLPRGQTEHLVIATRGAPVHTLNEITTLLRVKRREHSRKPDEMYELLAKHCSGPMIDMFSREPRDGWATWGAETRKFATEAA